MDQRMHQQALGVDENVPLLAFDLLARIPRVRPKAGPRTGCAMRVVPPPFSALFTLWLSMMAALGQASRSACSRQAT
jgi:hypothetical protein